jgi:hypothetical protein
MRKSNFTLNWSLVLEKYRFIWTLKIEFNREKSSRYIQGNTVGYVIRKKSKIIFILEVSW